MSDIRPTGSNLQNQIHTVTLTTPVATADVEKLKIGTIVKITGVIYTGRDAAHKRMVDTLEQGGKLPMDVEGQAIYYVGPAPARPGAIIGSCGPTTSYRMDPYAPALLEQGIKLMIGKGPRSPQVIQAMKKYKAVYLAAVGGAAALISRSVTACSVVAYEELGTEAIHRLEVKDFTCVVAIDSEGNNLYETGKLEFQVTDADCMAE